MHDCNDSVTIFRTSLRCPNHLCSCEGVYCWTSHLFTRQMAPSKHFFSSSKLFKNPIRDRLGHKVAVFWHHVGPGWEIESSWLGGSRRSGEVRDGGEDQRWVARLGKERGEVRRLQGGRDPGYAVRRMSRLGDGGPRRGNDRVSQNNVPRKFFTPPCFTSARNFRT